MIRKLCLLFLLTQTVSSQTGLGDLPETTPAAEPSTQESTPPVSEETPTESAPSTSTQTETSQSEDAQPEGTPASEQGTHVSAPWRDPSG